MSENFTSKLSDEVKKDLSEVDDKRFYVFIEIIVDLVMSLGHMFYEMGKFEKDFPSLIEYTATLPQDDMTTLMVNLVSREVEGFEILKTIMKINSLLPEITTYFDIPVDEKIALGEKIIQVAGELHEDLEKVKGEAQ